MTRLSSRTVVLLLVLGALFAVSCGVVGDAGSVRNLSPGIDLPTIDGPGMGTGGATGAGGAASATGGVESFGGFGGGGAGGTDPQGGTNASTKARP